MKTVISGMPLISMSMYNYSMTVFLIAMMGM